jgi:hypothetical protein
MALPKLNETLKFNMEIPSTGKKVKYRPYLVKEEKVLLQAFESGDLKTSLEAMVDTIDACLDQKQNIDTADLTTFDVEFMFTQIRAQSVGENSTIQVKCSNCEQSNEYQVDLSELSVDIDKQDMILDITDTISVEMRYPSYRNILEQDFEKLGEDADTMLNIIATSIAAVITADERIDASDVTSEELVEFLQSMTSTQLAKVGEFIQGAPSLKHTAKFTCEDCGTKNAVELKGLADFF